MKSACASSCAHAFNSRVRMHFSANFTADSQIIVIIGQLNAGVWNNSVYSVTISNSEIISATIQRNIQRKICPGKPPPGKVFVRAFVRSVFVPT